MLSAQLHGKEHRQAFRTAWRAAVLRYVCVRVTGWCLVLAFTTKTAEGRILMRAWSSGIAGAADEALGLEDSVEPWAAGLWTAFDESAGFNGGASSDPTTHQDEVASNTTSVSSTVSVLREAEKGAVKALPPFLPANLITYEKMFGPFSGATEIPEDIPKMPSALFSLHFVDEEAVPFGITAPKEAISDATATEIEYSLSHPFEASIVGARYLTSRESERKVLKLDIDINGSGITYSPGDSIGIKCPNRADDVDALLARLGLRGETLFRLEAVVPGRAPRRAASAKYGAFDRFPSPCSIREALLHHADILGTPKKAVLRALAAFCSDEEERARLLVLSSKSGADKYKVCVVSTCVVVPGSAWRVGVRLYVVANPPRMPFERCMDSNSLLINSSASLRSSTSFRRAIRHSSNS